MVFSLTVQTFYEVECDSCGRKAQGGVRTDTEKAIKAAREAGFTIDVWFLDGCLRTTHCCPECVKMVKGRIG